MKTNTALSLLLAASFTVGAKQDTTHQNPISPQKTSLVPFIGAKSVIPGWHLQSALHTETNLSAVSQPGYDVSSWHRVGPRATVMAGLIENGVYNDTTLFYSDNLQKVLQEEPEIFQSPWLYREEFSLDVEEARQHSFHGQRIFLNTHGITAKADIFVNGALVATRDVQQGSFGGHKYDVSPFVVSGGLNCVLIRVYPANYDKDLVVGFADWNPYPPDNGTGVWRDVEVLRTGSVSISSPRVVTSFPSEANLVEVTVKVDVENHDGHDVSGTVRGTIRSEDERQVLYLSQDYTLQAHDSRTISISTRLVDPQIWWPAAWGEQPLYAVQLNVTTGNGAVSDISRLRHFGVRNVTSYLNGYNDRAFTVNGRQFLVLGAGYSPDYFLRFDRDRARAVFGHVLDLGLNTVRLEGKLEHDEFYDLADRMGIMVIAGWECCDKWEAFDYNDDVNATKWTDQDYKIANVSMLHEATQMQPHPSILAFLVGSDFWPNLTATETYLSALRQTDWHAPIIASASQRGHPAPLLPDSGMKMSGPYDWVPPNYWYQEDPEDAEGAAFGFGSELGTGVGTPELSSLVRFLSERDLEDLWTRPEKGLFHMSREGTPFWDRGVYDRALVGRYGEQVVAKGLEGYVGFAQVMDYESTRAQFEAFSIRQSAERPATGMIYWMLNSAWPNLHWQLFDYYLTPGGAYYGAKTGCRVEHVAYDYVTRGIYIINHSLDIRRDRNVTIDIINTEGNLLLHSEHAVETNNPTSSTLVTTIPEVDTEDVMFMRLILSQADSSQDQKSQSQSQSQSQSTLSRNVYWLPPPSTEDSLDPANSTWYLTPVSDYADLTALSSLRPVLVKASLSTVDSNPDPDPLTNLCTYTISLWIDPTNNNTDDGDNTDNTPAFFIRLFFFDRLTGTEIDGVRFSDNYVTVFPGERVGVVAVAAASVGVLGAAALGGEGVNAVVVQDGGGDGDGELDGDEDGCLGGCC